METLFGLLVFLILLIGLFSTQSKKETAKERYAEAAGELAHSAADSIANFAHSIAEPADKKKIRLAKNTLASKNASLYYSAHYYKKEPLADLLAIDESLRDALKVLGLPEDRWKTLATKIYHIGALREEENRNSDYDAKMQRSSREDLINREDYDLTQAIKDALQYFGIEESEWIKYGATVIQMHNLFDDVDMKKFGII